MRPGFPDDDPQVAVFIAETAAVTALLVDLKRVIRKLEDGIQRTYFGADHTKFAGFLAYVIAMRLEHDDSSDGIGI